MMTDLEDRATTPRREARENYIRFILAKAEMPTIDIEHYLETKQAMLENRSILDMVYSGEYEKAVSVVETFLDSGAEEKEIPTI